jgi:transmembrane sensor
VTERIDRLNRLDPLIRDALAWVVRLKSGEATLADAERLVDWRAQSPAHERAFRDAV